MMKRLLVFPLALIFGVLACSSPVLEGSSTPPPSATLAPASPPSPSIAPVTATLPPAPDTAAFEADLQTALSEKDFAHLEQSMGAAFMMQYEGGAGGMITVSDAAALLRDSLLAESAAVTIDDTIPAGVIDNTVLSSLAFEVDKPLFSRGWGVTTSDHAIILLARDESSQPYFAGLIYARGGFAGVTAQASPEATNETPPTPTPPTADPAPRGASVYLSEFKQGWWEHSENNVTTEHTGDGYEITVADGPNAGWSFTTQVDRAEFYAEVSTTVVDCPSPDGAYGIVFHYVDDSRFRFFMVWCDGHYSLMERTATTTAAVLVEGDLPQSFDAASGQHRIGILAQTSTLVMYVDDVRIGQISVPTMPNGDIGPYVQTLARAAISILYTGLNIYEPE